MTRAALLAAAAICAAGPVRAEDPTPVTVEVGKAIDLCKEKLVACPASSFMCDASNVARLESGASDGIELKGISPGKTLCTVRGFEGAFRRVFSVTVKGAAGGDAPKGTATAEAQAR